jgi:hypothetical protein
MKESWINAKKGKNEKSEINKQQDSKAAALEYQNLFVCFIKQ